MVSSIGTALRIHEFAIDPLLRDRKHPFFTSFAEFQLGLKLSESKRSSYLLLKLFQVVEVTGSQFAVVEMNSGPDGGEHVKSTGKKTAKTRGQGGFSIIPSMAKLKLTTFSEN